MKHCELSKYFIENKLGDVKVLAIYFVKPIYFIKLVDKTGRVCYSWTYTSPTTRNTRVLKKINNGNPNTSLLGSYDIVVPSCDGVVYECSNKIQIMSMINSNPENPETITLVNELCDVIESHCIVYPLVSIDNLDNNTWKLRHDEILRATARDIQLRISKRTSYIPDIYELLNTINSYSENILTQYISNTITSNNDETDFISLKNLNDEIKKLYSIELLSQNILPLLELLRLRIKAHNIIN